MRVLTVVSFPHPNMNASLLAELRNITGPRAVIQDPSLDSNLRSP